MVVVRIRDKRYSSGYAIKFFHSDGISKEIIEFIKKTPRAYWIESKYENYYTREDFLAKYGT